MSNDWEKLTKWQQRAEFNAPATPTWSETKLIPICSQEKCAQFDGKRCEALGHQPSNVCEPTVTQMGILLNEVLP